MIFKKKQKESVVLQPQDPQEQQDASLEQFNSTLDGSFFYTSDKKLDAIDDADVIKHIQQYWPEFKQQTKDAQLKKMVLEMVEDRAFTDELLQHFDMQLSDLLRILHKQYASLFNNLFISKLRDAVKRVQDGRSC